MDDIMPDGALADHLERAAEKGGGISLSAEGLVREAVRRLRRAGREAEALEAAAQHAVEVSGERSTSIAERLETAAGFEEAAMNRMSWHAPLMRLAAERLRILAEAPLVGVVPPILPLSTEEWEVRVCDAVDGDGWWLVAGPGYGRPVWARRRT